LFNQLYNGDEQNDGLIDADRDHSHSVSNKSVQAISQQLDALITFLAVMVAVTVSKLIWLWSVSQVTFLRLNQLSQAVLASASEVSLAPRLKILLDWSSGATTLWANSSASCQKHQSVSQRSVRESIWGEIKL